jgi:hypothetical protein
VAEQRFLTHDLQHALVIDRPVLSLQFGRHAPIAVPWELKYNPLNGVTQCNVALGLRGRAHTSRSD